LGPMTDIAFQGVLNGSPQTLQSASDLGVSDSTGSGDGWHVTIAASQFMGVTMPGSLPPTALLIGQGSGPTFVGPHLDPNASQGANPPQNSLVTDTPLVVPLSSGAAAAFFDAAAGSGSGRYTVNVPYSLAVPASAYAGGYESTMVVTIITGP
ncbi:MAG: hypothetical protein JO247_18200, partial [Chloroflexi bacterium]|nr:hypothetical protein [Chloroflexota bacterium]